MSAQTLESFSLFGFEVPLTPEQFLYLLISIVGLIFLIIIVAFIKARGHAKPKPKKDEEELIKARKAELERVTQRPAKKVEEVKKKSGFFASIFAKKRKKSAEEEPSKIPAAEPQKPVLELPETQKPAKPEVIQYGKKEIVKSKPKVIRGAEIMEEAPEEDIIVEESKGTIEKSIEEAYRGEPAEKIEKLSQKEQLMRAIEKKPEATIFGGETGEHTKEETVPAPKPEIEQEEAVQIEPAEKLAEPSTKRVMLTQEELNTVERIVTVLLPKKEKYTPEQIRKIMLGEGYSEKITEEVVRRIYGNL